MDGALSMALDEVLCRSGEAVLRGYFWAETMISLGNFVSIQEANTINFSEIIFPKVRRMTGGGCVRHEKNSDFSYSLIVPRDESLAKMRPMETYRWIHERVMEVLRESGVAAELTPVEIENGGASVRDCFRRAVTWDILVDGRKIAGAGQKLGKWGFLHQGNVQGVRVPDDFLMRLGEGLAERVEVREISTEMLAAASELAEKKYRNACWTDKY